MVGGLTKGNLSKIASPPLSKTIDNQAAPNGGPSSPDELASNEGEPQVKTRKRYARGISLQIGHGGEKQQPSQLRHLAAIAPSAHHRFDKDSVHLRSMYRQLYPGETPLTTKN